MLEKNHFSSTTDFAIHERKKKKTQGELDGSGAVKAPSVPGGVAAAVPTDAAGTLAVLEKLAREVEHDLATPDHAPATERAYAHDWSDFEGFCARHGLGALRAEPQTLVLYLKML